MKKTLITIAIFLLLGTNLFTGQLASAASPKTLYGTMLGISGSQIYFQTTSGAKYAAEFSKSVITKKNGSAISINDFLIGDKIEVIGNLWSDNSISASSIKDLTLYAHTGTFTGKIISIDPGTSSFNLQTSSPEIKIIYTNPLTSFKKNGGAISFNGLEIGMTANVKGIWERKNSSVTATLVDAKLRYVNISITGQLRMNLPGSITIVSNNTIYGVETTNAKILNKKGKIFPQEKLAWGDTIKVTGKHVSGSVKIIGSVVKDLEREK
jgi:hypothetical protein